jgi:hypothetical protein
MRLRHDLPRQSNRFEGRADVTNLSNLKVGDEVLVRAKVITLGYWITVVLEGGTEYISVRPHHIVSILPRPIAVGDTVLYTKRPHDEPRLVIAIDKVWAWVCGNYELGGFVAPISDLRPIDQKGGK